jgi:hypothetical protein
MFSQTFSRTAELIASSYWRILGATIITAIPVVVVMAALAFATFATVLAGDIMDAE